MDQLESMPMPTLLRKFAMQALGRELAESIKVKNTFIDGFDFDSDDDMEGLPVMAKVKTCPAKVLLDLSSLGQPPEPEQQPESSPTSRSAQRPSTVRAMTPEPEQLESQTSRSVQRPSTVPATTAVTAQPTVVIEPLESRQPRPSRGAVLHKGGMCRPCAWYWKPQGCNLGADCCHCHMCDRAEIKTKKTKKAELRAQEEDSASGDGARPEC
jgi:hypothetical protein